ncbi:MAG: DUF1684 domain-containing protein [Bacteroidota bacterium]
MKSVILKFLFLSVVFFTACDMDKENKTINQSTNSFNPEAYIDSIMLERTNTNKEFKDTAHSPLTQEDIKHFESLDFYPVNVDYRIKAKFVRERNAVAFGMKTTTERLPEYEKYGEAHFKLNGKKLVLNIYQNQDLIKSEKYANYLFAPFADKTSGGDSYGGGRYLDLRIPKSDEIIIDFNRAYNPYCAYNVKYSCPLIPKENILDTKIEAGVKSYGKH